MVKRFVQCATTPWVPTRRAPMTISKNRRVRLGGGSVISSSWRLGVAQHGEGTEAAPHSHHHPPAPRDEGGTRHNRVAGIGVHSEGAPQSVAYTANRGSSGLTSLIREA